MQQDGPKTPKYRPRARTGAQFPNILKGRKSEPSPAAPSTPMLHDDPSSLSLEFLVESLKPPAVLSLTHARNLSVVLQKELPDLEALTPVVARLCEPGVPSALLAAGLDVIAACAASQARPPNDLERGSLFSILRGSDADWAPETWRPRFNCLSILTREGSTVAGFETAFLRFAERCISSAFEGLLSADDSDRQLREKYIESVSYIIRKTLNQNASLYTDQDFSDVLSFFDDFVQESLACFTVTLGSQPILPSPGMRPISPSHRRNTSSLSSPISYPGSRPPVREPMTALDHAVFPVQLYMEFLDMHRRQLSPKDIKDIVSVVLRIIAVHMNPLPYLSAWPIPQHRPRPTEEAALKQLFALLSGPYSQNVAMHITACLTSDSWQEALGAFRTVRAVLRDAAGTRMALMALRRPRFDMDEFAPTGQIVATEAYADVLERAHKDGVEVPSFTLSRLRIPVGKAVCDWSTRAAAEQVLEEALGMVKDIIAETSDRTEDKGRDHDTLNFNVDEGRFIGTILSEAVKYIQRLRVSMKLPYLPIDNPVSAPTTLIHTLCAQLSLPLSIPIIPSLPSTLLSITSCLTDAQTASIPRTMYDLGFLTPTSPEWLDNITTLFVALVGQDRPISSREVVGAINLVHLDLMGVPVYRRQLGRCIYALAKRPDEDRQIAGAAKDGDEQLFETCTNELVWRIIESGPDEKEDEDEEPLGEHETEDWAAHIVQLLVRHAEGFCPCSLGMSSDDNPIPPSPLPSQECMPGTSYQHWNSGTTPALSRVSSEFSVMEGDMTSVQPTASSSNSMLPPIKSILPGWGIPRNSRDSEAPPSPVTTRAEPEPTVSQNCRPLIASISLVNAFLSVSFSAPPRAAHAVRLFKIMLAILSNAKCTRAKLTILQLLMRLRADRDHRLYSLHNLDDEIHPLAVLLDRSQVISREKAEEIELQRARSISRGLRRGKPKSAPGSRSRSRPTPPLMKVSPRKLQGPLWMIPESIPFKDANSHPSSHGITTYELNAPPEWEELKNWLPVSDYVFALVDILKSETDWELLSYILCHLPVQLANKHFFCGPKTKDGIVALLVTLCTVTFKGESAPIITEQMPDTLRLRDAQGVVYHTLTVLISYRRIFDERKHHDMLVEAFLTGLNSQPSTIKFCLNALSICAFELPTSITKNLSHILEKLSRIMTNAAMAVHILDFVCIVGSLPSLYANFREQEFKLVFAVAVTYIHHHNSPDTRGLSGRESFALSQHVLVIAYYIIYVWFLAVALPDRPNHVEFLTRRLLLATEAKGSVDEQTEVCFDWLARYAYATADPKPAYSLLGDIVMNPPRNENNEPIETPSNAKTWIWGNSFVSIRTLPKRGWIEVETVRPSGETRFLCKLENFPQVNPGDVDPDRFTDSAIMMADRDPKEIERNAPDPEDDDQSRDTTRVDSEIRARGVFISRAEPEASNNRPDPVTGYVWAQSAPSQRRKEVSIDPSFFAMQLSQYPFLPKQNARSRLVSPSPQLESLLRTLKRTPVIDTHKIAILYVAPGQKTEREILGNRHGSPAYTRFLEGMGRLIRLQDQRDVYTGDMIPETDGEFAYAWWDDIVQVVYHTATLMPNIPSDPSFIFKKRHVGNDKVRIVWNDSGQMYDQDAIPSAFNFVNLIIQPHSLGTIAAFSNEVHEREFFKITMQRMEGMPDFGPIGDYKLVSAENLAPLVRQVSLLADFFSEVYEATDKDTTMCEYITNWRRRLQYINTFANRWESPPSLDAEDQEDRDVRDFTKFF